MLFQLIRDCHHLRTEEMLIHPGVKCSRKKVLENNVSSLGSHFIWFRNFWYMVLFSRSDNYTTAIQLMCYNYLVLAAKIYQSHPRLLI